MPTIPQRIASTFAVLCGRYGDVTEAARDRGQSRQSLYREAGQVVDAVGGSAAGARIEALEREVVPAPRPGRRPPATAGAGRRVEPREAGRVGHRGPGRGRQPPGRPKAPPGLAPAGGAGRLDTGPGHRRGRDAAPAGCWRSSTRRLGPASSRSPPMRFFRPQAGPDAGRAGQPLLARRAQGGAARWGHLGRATGPLAGAAGRDPRRRHRPGQGRPAGQSAEGEVAPPRPGGWAGCLPPAPRGGPGVPGDVGRGVPGDAAGRGGAGEGRSATRPGAAVPRPRLDGPTPLESGRAGLRSGRLRRMRPGGVPEGRSISSPAPACSTTGARPRRSRPRRYRSCRDRRGPRCGGCWPDPRASRSWTRPGEGWRRWAWSRTS